jgi:hypothetical protein
VEWSNLELPLTAPAAALTLVGARFASAEHLHERRSVQAQAKRGKSTLIVVGLKSSKTFLTKYGTAPVSSL